MKSWLGLFALVAAPLLASAQVVPAPPPEAHQFDFWLGAWEVFAPDGKKAGDSCIEPAGAGWGLLESWTGTSGATGKSLNTWFPAKRCWQQFWVGNEGALELSGGLNGSGEMVLTGVTENAAGKTGERITWSPRPDGTVRQLWEQSADAGKTWTVAFDGLYRKKSG